MSEVLLVGGKTDNNLAKGIAVENNGMVSIIDSSNMMQRVSEPLLLSIPTYDGSNEPVHPAIVRMDKKWNGYKYWMAFTPYPHADETKENPSIVASNDCINWVVPNGLTNPIAPFPGVTGSYNRDTQLIFAQDENGGRGRLYCYYGRVGVEPTFQRKYSDDGVTWSQAEGSNLDLWGIVRKSANDWECFAKSGSNYFIKWVSTDGLNWTRNNPRVPTNIIGNMWHHSVYYDNTGYHFLMVANPKDRTISYLTLYYGYSKDGSEVIFDTTPILSAKDGTFYGAKLYQSCLCPYGDNKFKVFFSCASEEDYWRIGSFDAIISSPQTKIPRKFIPESTERYLAYKIEKRDKTDMVINVPELCEYENKILLIHSTLKDSSGAVKPSLYIVNNMRNDFTGSSDILEYGADGTTTQKAVIPNDTYASRLITKEHLSALGYMLPHNAGIRIILPSAPTDGDITIMIKAWA